jgi:hypothetical protein
MRIKQVSFIYLLFFTMSFSLVGMHITTRKIGTKKSLFNCRNLINKSDELDIIRQKFDKKNSPQDIKNISQGKIVIKEEIPLGKRYGTCHNYAFTKLMGIVGKAPKVLNIPGLEDYYAGLLKDKEYGVSIVEFFDPVANDGPNPKQPGDIIMYISPDKEKDLLQRITHTGIVVGDDCIESKWGPIRAVFEHPIWYVPACFGNMVIYGRLKMSGPDLLKAVQKRLQQDAVKEMYGAQAYHAQQLFFDKIKQYEQNRWLDKAYEIYDELEYNMNVHIDVPDENGLTPRMHAKKMQCERLEELFAAYEKFNE